MKQGLCGSELGFFKLDVVLFVEWVPILFLIVDFLVGTLFVVGLKGTPTTT